MPEIGNKAKGEGREEDIADKMLQWFLGSLIVAMKVVAILGLALVILLLLVLIAGPFIGFLIDFGRVVGRKILSAIIGWPGGADAAV